MIDQTSHHRRSCRRAASPARWRPRSPACGAGALAGRRRPRSTAFAVAACAEPVAGRRRRASGRLRRHRREGEAGGGLGPRQDRGATRRCAGLNGENGRSATGSPDGDVLPALRHARRPGRPGQPRRRAQRQLHQARARASSSPPTATPSPTTTSSRRPTTVEVTTDDGKTYTAKVIGTDPRTDLALIKVDGAATSPT